MVSQIILTAASRLEAECGYPVNIIRGTESSRGEGLSSSTLRIKTLQTKKKHFFVYFN